MGSLQLSESIIGVLDGVQTSTTGHSKLLDSFTSLYEKAQSPQTFYQAFFPPFSNVLLVYKRELAVEKVVAFVTEFAVKTSSKNDEEYPEDDDIEESFFSFFIDGILPLHKAKDKAVRFRVCQLLAKIMNGAAEEFSVIGEDRLDRIREAMLLRLHDKIPVVRVHAVLALEFLQSTDPMCPVIPIFLELMAKDPSPDVRRCILNKIGVSDQSLPAVIERTRDVKENIRHDAFLWLSTKCSIRNITISSRIKLLRHGLNDPSKLVQKGCVNGLLRSWSLESQDGDFITLLARLDVENSPEVVETALVKLFENFSTGELVMTMLNFMAAINVEPGLYKDSPQTTPISSSQTTTPTTRATLTPSKATPTSDGICLDQTTPSSVKVISRCSMKCEEVFYWRCLCHYLHTKGTEGEEQLEKIVPTLSEFCDYMRSYAVEVVMKEEDLDAQIQSQFVMQQLCLMLAVFDLSDEMGRTCLSQLVSDLLILPRFSTSLINPILKLQTRLWIRDSERIEKIAEVIAELRQPSTLDDEGCGSGTTDVQGQDESYLASNSSFLYLQDDPNTLIRCLTITSELIKSLQMRKLDNPTLLTLADSLNENPFVRDMAFFCLGLACLLDLNLARKNILLFLQVSRVDHESAQATALKILFDLLHMYGFEAFNIMGDGGKENKEEEAPETQESEGDSDIPSTSEFGGEEEEEDTGKDQSNGLTQKLLNIMATFLEGESMLLREVAGEGICKLLLSRRILSPKLLAKLLLLWYNPITQDEPGLRNTLGLFLPAFSALDSEARLSLSEVYLPVMRMISESPLSSPLHAINTNNLSDFILQLTRPPESNEDSVHDSLSISICNEVLGDPLSSDVRVYWRTLSLMELTPSNKSNTEQLLSLWELMNNSQITDKLTLRYLKKFGDALKLLNPVTMEREKERSEASQPVEDSDVTVTVTTTETMTTTTSTQDVATPILRVKNSEIPTKMTSRAPLTKPSVKSTKSKVKKAPLVVNKRGGARMRRRKSVVVTTEDISTTEEESESENIEPEDITALPSKPPSTRAAVQSAISSSVLENYTVSSTSEDSDDSVVGEHSPFIRRSSRERETTKPLQLHYDDDDDEDEDGGVVLAK